MKYLSNGFIYRPGPIIMPNASIEDKARLKEKGHKIEEVDDATAEKIKREIGER